MQNHFPLPLTDNCWFIDNTALEYYTTCRESFKNRSILGRELAEDGSATNFGSGIHKALEHRARYEDTKTIPSIETEQIGILEKYFQENPQPLDAWRTPSLAVDIIHRYNLEYPFEPWAVFEHNATKVIESPFAIPLCTFDVPDLHPHPITFVWMGRIDLVIKKPDSSLWNLDHKTSSREDMTQYENDNAQLGYLWAVNKALGIQPRGYVINVLYTRPPLKSGGLSKSTAFARQPFFVEWERVEYWERNLIAICEDILNDCARGFFPMETKWCSGKYGPCQYLDVCKLAPENRMVALQSNLYRKVTWTPLQKT